MSRLDDSIADLAGYFEDGLREAEADNFDRHEVADLLERLASEVRKGYTELPEHWGPWWHEVHGEESDLVRLG